MAKYTGKSIEAYKLSEENFEDVVEWCGTTEYDAEAFTLVLGDTLASIGDYVVQDILGDFTIWEESDFLTQFQLVPATVAAIGLDEETDSNKITAIIAALRAFAILGPNE